MVTACARLGTPPGGPVDEDPPVITGSKPGNYSTNYSRNNVYIGFDEWVTLKNPFSEFTISPPLEKTPLPRTRGKGVLVELPSAELDTFTYTLDFGESIADNNEGNLLPNFQFVLSKMAHIDSFSVSGTIVDAFTLEPTKEPLFVYLRSNLADSAPYSVKPSFLAKSTPKGEFKINHVAPGIYSLMALKDANANMIFDITTEVIAFYDEPVCLLADTFLQIKNRKITEELSRIDTSKSITDSLSASNLSHSGSLLPADSIVNDSIERMVYGFAINLFSFTEYTKPKQYLVDYKRESPEKFNLTFNDIPDSLPKLELLNPKASGDWYLKESNPRGDTLVFWLPDSNLIKTDSLQICLTHFETDTLGLLAKIYDTLLLKSPSSADAASGSSDKRKGGLRLPFGEKDKIADTLIIKAPRLPLKNNVNQAAHHLYLPVIITAEAPLQEYNKNLIEVVRLEDSLSFPISFSLEADSSRPRQLVIEFSYEPFTTYQVNLHQGAITDIFGRTIDSTQIRFVTQRDDYYGMVELNMNNVNSPVIVQLLTSKDQQVVKQTIIQTSGKVQFDYLTPATYKLKVIFDDNNNGTWDTGNLKTKQQPERVLYFTNEAEVRSNWKNEYDWEL